MALQITFLGHSTFKIVTPEGKVLIIDPWVRNNPKCPENQKNQPKVDVLLCTHGHYDHIDDAVEMIREHQPKVVGIYELITWLARKGAKNVAPMNKGGTQEVEGVKVTMVHAVHSCGIQDDDGSFVYGGEACGFVLEFSDGTRLYHAGDTGPFSDMQIIADLYEPDIAMLPIGGHFVMGPREAAYAIEVLRPKAVIPMHFGTFPLLSGKPDDLANLCQELGIELLTMNPGEVRTVHVQDLEVVAE